MTRAYRPGQVRDPRADRTSGTGSLSRPESRGNGGGRDLPTATAVGALLGAAFIGALIWRPAAVMVIVLLAIGLAAFEFFTQATAAGYRPPLVLGVVACVSAPLSAYWIGDAALPLVFAFAFIASAVVFVGGDGIDSAPLPSTAVTMLALVWIGLLGSYAALILRFSPSSLKYRRPVLCAQLAKMENIVNWNSSRHDNNSSEIPQNAECIQWNRICPGSGK